MVGWSGGRVVGINKSDTKFNSVKGEVELGKNKMDTTSSVTLSQTYFFEFLGRGYNFHLKL